jgi:hypothetical protein
MLAWPLVLNAAAQHWVVTETKDAMTDEVRRAAVVTNKDGFTFSVYRLGADIWANFAIPNSDSAQLDAEKLIVYRVDDWVAKRLTDRVAERPKIEVQPKWVNWRIGTHGSPDVWLTLRQFPGGRRLVVRFYLFTGGWRDTEFTLTGAREALAYVAGLPAVIWDEQMVKEREKRELALQAAREGANDRCRKFPSVVGPEGEPLRQCLARMDFCVGKYGKTPDPVSAEATELIACFNAVNP